MLAVGAYDNGKLIGLAGCSADCEMMYQIGVDVLPEYRRKGLAAAALTAHYRRMKALGATHMTGGADHNLRGILRL